MASFDLALPTIFQHEGGYAYFPADPGGATVWGISLRWLRTLGDLDHDGFMDGDINHDGDVNTIDIRTLSKHNAIEFYRTHWWDKYRYENIGDQEIATKLFSFSINMGSQPAHRIIQRAVRSAIGIKLDEDGILGLKTLHAINMAKPIKLLPALKSEAAGYYRSIRLKDGDEKKFISGWLNRAYSDCLLSNQEKSA